MFKKTKLDKELELFIDGAEAKIRSTLSNNFIIQEQTLEIIIKGVKYSEDKNLRGSKMIWNIAGFINIVSYDLKIVGQDLTFARSEWQKRYYARHASLLIFETIRLSSRRLNLN